MKTMMRKPLKSIVLGHLMLATAVCAVSCADYNETGNFAAEPDPTFVEPYKDLAPIKSYIDRKSYPNMTLGATLKVADFNKQELAHAAAVTNFDNIAFGNTLMSGAIINEKGVMNFLNMMDLLDHVEEIGGEVFGSPIVANTNQADKWMDMLTAPIEIIVQSETDKEVDYTKAETFTGTNKRGKGTIVKNYDGSDNALMLPKKSKVWIAEGFDVDTLATYTVTFYAKVDKDDNENESVYCTFCDSTVYEKEEKAKFYIKPNKWVKMVIEQLHPNPKATTGYFMIDGNQNAEVYIKSVTVTHMPDNHRPQTEQEMKDTISYALNAWCDGLMKINAGRINSFDLIDEALDTKLLDNGKFDLKHSKDKIFWQDIFGSENYAAVVSKAASEAYQQHGGDPAKLRFFISESGLDAQQKFESLTYWMGIWENKGAKIDGINAKLNLSYSEDDTKQAANKKAVESLLSNLASTGKLIRLSNFDIKYQDATGASVAAKDITTEQRQKLADYYGYVIKSYMNKIPHEKQAGICKGNLVDTSDPVGLWSVDSKTRDWVRNATYKAFCDALSGK